MDNTNESTISVGLVQMACSPDASKNLEKAVDSIRAAAKQGAQIICLPELFLTQYFCQTEDPDNFSLAEPLPGPTSTTLSNLAKELQVVLIVPLFEKRTQGIYHNTAIVIDADGSIAGTYRKMHIPDDPCFFEKFYFTPGDTGFKSFSTRYGKVGVLICWDQWFPEAARLTALSGAQFLFYPTAIGYQDEDAKVSQQQISAWETIQKSHAISNGVFLASVNRVGRENALTFWGKSFICNPFGEVIGQAEDEPQILIAKCPLSEIESTRQNWPFLRDRRVDAYQGLSKLYLDDDE
ncbi:MAG: carbon-nitrogen hydrolase [Nitrospinaceae bacterium]|jgi:N-carbamoylputrescine amidase|nr:carbon-nitrogen hydrolase [Nitrospinaceae bacterium]|tara:strand:+ start:774 stop:1655 length:882 start_codon:yes stop_codon:yes gene_type:complete